MQELENGAAVSPFDGCFEGRLFLYWRRKGGITGKGLSFFLVDGLGWRGIALVSGNGLLLVCKAVVEVEFSSAGIPYELPLGQVDRLPTNIAEYVAANLFRIVIVKWRQLRQHLIQEDPKRPPVGCSRLGRPAAKQLRCGRLCRLVRNFSLDSSFRA